MTFVAALATFMVVQGAGAKADPMSGAAAASGCQLNSAKGNIKHVIYIQFDNTHLRRDNSSVPSDLQQMPHLLNFITGNGTMMANDHTALISHTATGILTSLTGVYPDRMGQPVSNSFRYFTPSGSSRTGVSFAYWTAPIFDPAGPPFPPAGQTDFTPEMINENGKIAPAPWVPYTRAGCDVGQVSTANTILENTGIDIPTFFGPASAEAAQASADHPGQSATQTFADYVGIGVHCGQGSLVCGASSHAKPDLLPDEPGSYTGYDALMGAKYVNPVIKTDGPMTDLNNNVIKDQNGHIGFPGFDGMSASVTLSWVAQMQEANIPVTYAYISDAHDGHGISGKDHYAYGPGEAGYVQQLHEYDQAFQTFFDRLAADGINKSNTLFVFTVDEGDHFAGDQPTNAGCDGVTTPCTYNRVGEINGDLRRMIHQQFNDSTLFAVHSDVAPTVYVQGNPSRTDSTVRKLERESAALSWLNPYTGQVQNDITQALADPVAEQTLHMVTADPMRTPTFTLFADPDWFFFATSGASPAACATPSACAFIPSRSLQSFAWNHGGIQDEIASTWVGYVGPGVNNDGTSDVWTDHTDVRPTMLTLLGLHDDYTADGRTVVQPLAAWAVPQTLRAHRETLIQLGDVYKQLNASFGSFAMYTLKASTAALASGSATDDSKYTAIEDQIAALTSQRNALASQIKAGLSAAAFDGQALNEQEAKGWIDQAQSLIDQAASLAAS
jgi:predicted transcriptional regulator